jgi:hypothetical protein
MAKPRDDFSKLVVDALAKRASFICSNPDCRAQTLAPSGAESGKYLYIGKAAHICAAAKGGPRFDPQMSAEERGGIDNGIFLCSSCADLIDKNSGLDFSPGQLHEWKRTHEKWVKANLNKRSQGRGGEGGSGKIIGNRGTIIGGRGGEGGVSGIGGKGGGGFIKGDDGLIIGGNGGNCGSADGRGGRGARGPAERFGLSTDMWGFGRGGSGGNHPEFNRRVGLLRTIRAEYKAKFPEDATYIEAGIDLVPVDWVNQRLAELEETWQVWMGSSGYQLPALAENEKGGYD